MQRQPKRKAASDALDKMQRVREWEDMPECSKRFRECAAQIEAEFRAEETQRHVCSEDLENEEDTHAVSDSEHDSAYTDDSFVERDDVSEDGDFDPTASTQAMSASETSSDQDSACESIDDTATECESTHDAATECESTHDAATECGNNDAAADSVREQEPEAMPRWRP